MQRTLVETSTRWQKYARTLDESGGSWLRTVAVRMFLDWWRRHRICEGEDSLALLPSFDPDPEQQFLAAEKRKVTLLLCAELSEEDRLLIRLRIDEALSYEEAAAELGTSTGAVHVRWNRLLGRLREKAADLGIANQGD